MSPERRPEGREFTWPPPEEDLDAIEVVDLSPRPQAETPPAESRGHQLSAGAEPARPLAASASSAPEETPAGQLHFTFAGRSPRPVHVVEIDARGGPAGYPLDIRRSAAPPTPAPDERRAPLSSADAPTLEWPPRESELDAISVVDLHEGREAGSGAPEAREVATPLGRLQPPLPPANAARDGDPPGQDLVLRDHSDAVPANLDLLPDEAPTAGGPEFAGPALSPASTSRSTSGFHWAAYAAALVLAIGALSYAITNGVVSIGGVVAPSVTTSRASGSPADAAPAEPAPHVSDPLAREDPVVPAQEPSPAPPPVSPPPPAADTREVAAVTPAAALPSAAREDRPSPDTDRFADARTLLSSGDPMAALRVAVGLRSSGTGGADALINEILVGAQAEAATARREAIARAGTTLAPGIPEGGRQEALAAGHWRTGRFEQALRTYRQAVQSYRRTPLSASAPVAGPTAGASVPVPEGSAGTASSPVATADRGAPPIAPPPAVSPAAADPSPAVAASPAAERPAPPPVEAAAPAPRPPATAAIPVSDDGGVRRALRAYQVAYERLDAAAAAEVYPTVDRRALARAFDGLRSQRIEFERCDVAMGEGTARATCSGRAAFVPRVGSQAPRVESRTWTFVLRRSGEDWQITSALADRP